MSRTLSKFSLPFDEATTSVHFPKPLIVCGIMRVLLVYINRPVCARVCVRVCPGVYNRLQLLDRRSHALQILPTPQKPAYRYLPVPRSKLYDPPKWWKRTSSRFSWRKVWNGVKCNFSSPHHHIRKNVRNLSNRRVRMWNFTRIGPKTKKLWLSIDPVRRLFEQPGLGTPQKGVNCNFSLPEFDKPYGVRKLSILDV